MDTTRANTLHEKALAEYRNTLDTVALTPSSYTHLERVIENMEKNLGECRGIPCPCHLYYTGDTEISAQKKSCHSLDGRAKNEDKGKENNQESKEVNRKERGKQEGDKL